MESLSRQELIYAARALRVEASLTEAKAQDPKYGTAQATFARSAESLRTLADKFDRVAKAMRQG